MTNSNNESGSKRDKVRPTKKQNKWMNPAYRKSEKRKIALRKKIYLFQGK